MRFIERVRRAYRAATGIDLAVALDDRYWFHQGYGRMSAAGVRVSPELALTSAAVYACVRVVSETIASLPILIYKRLADGSKELATEHPLWEVLHDQPNSWMTSFEWVELMQTHLELNGNAYNFIQPGAGQAIAELLPIHPDRVTVSRLPGSQRLIYKVRTNANTETFNQDQIFHVRGHSLDGLTGMGIVSVGSEVIGAALAQQDYSSRFWANDSKPGGVLEHPDKMSPEAYVRLKESFQEAHSAENRHKVLMLEEGAKYAAIAISNKESQFLETIQARRSEVCSLFRVPPHKISDLTRATFSNIESQNIEFATDCIRPRCVRLERRINSDLIEAVSGEGEQYFVEFQMDALLRGDLKSRYEAYSVAIDHGWMSPNDARRSENMNPIPDGDIYIRQMNTVPLGTDPQTVNDSAPPEDDTAVSGKKERRTLQMKRLREIAASAAERCVRKEVKGLREIFAKSDDVESAVERFYGSHTAFLMSALRLDEGTAREYCTGNAAWVQAEREEAVRAIDARGSDALAEIAVGMFWKEPRQIRVNVMPQISLPAITVQPMEVKLTLDQPKTIKRGTVERGADGKMNFVIEEQNGA